MKGHPTHNWEYVLTTLRGRAEADGAVAPMRDAVERLVASPYAAGLHPVLSMHTLRLYQHDVAGSEDEEVRLDYAGDEFVVRHRTGATPDPRSILKPVPGIWTKRGPDAMALLERAFGHLRWFVEYHDAEPVNLDRGPAV